MIYLFIYMFIYLVKVGVYLVIERGQAIDEGDESARRGRAENFAVFRAMGCDAAAPFKRPCKRRRAHEAAKSGLLQRWEDDFAATLRRHGFEFVCAEEVAVIVHPEGECAALFRR